MGVRVSVVLICISIILPLYGSANRSLTTLKNVFTPFQKKSFQHPYTIFENPQVSNPKDFSHSNNQLLFQKTAPSNGAKNVNVIESLYAEAAQIFGIGERPQLPKTSSIKKSLSKASLVSRDDIALPPVPENNTVDTVEKINNTKRSLPPLPEQKLIELGPIYDTVAPDNSVKRIQSSYDTVANNKPALTDQSSLVYEIVVKPSLKSQAKAEYETVLGGGGLEKSDYLNKSKPADNKNPFNTQIATDLEQEIKQLEILRKEQRQKLDKQIDEKKQQLRKIKS